MDKVYTKRTLKKLNMSKTNLIIMIIKQPL